MNEGAVSVKGLSELNRAFQRIDAGLKKDMKKQLLVVGEPIRKAAESKAVAEISHIGSHWSRMRLGATNTVVYMVPASRSRKRKGSARPNLAGLLMDKAMQPAFDENQEEVVAGLEEWIDRLGAENGF